MKALESWVFGIALTVLLSVGLSVGTHAEEVVVQPSVAAVMVNINTASADVLAEELNGIGMKKAERIVQYREANGGFESVDDLTYVKGVGPKFLEVNRDLLVVN